MSVKEIEDHAKRYSQSYKRGYGPWKDNFPAMAIKTVSKLNISKNGPLSTELQTAVEADQAVIEEDGRYNYVDGRDPIEEQVKASSDKKKDIIDAQTSDDDEDEKSDDDKKQASIEDDDKKSSKKSKSKSSSKKWLKSTM